MNRIRAHIAFVLMLWTFVSSAGMYVHLHFCGDELRAAGLSDQVANACPMHAKPASEAKKACCSSEQPIQEMASTSHCNLPMHEGKSADDCCDDQQLALDLETESIFSAKSLRATPTFRVLNSGLTADFIGSAKLSTKLALAQGSPPGLFHPPSSTFITQVKASTDIPVFVQSFLI